VKEDEAGSGNSITDSVNSGSGSDYQIFLLMGLLVWVTYSSITQSVFILDRMKYSSCDYPAKIPVDYNAS
jgi:hypothetical protein